MKDKKQLSTTALSKALALPLKELFSILSAKGWVEKKGDHWSLTLSGIEHGGQFVTHPLYGKYITWPVHTDLDALGLNDKSEFITATDIGDSMELSGRQVNAILADLGWIKKENTGWVTTTTGTLNCGLQRQSIQTGNHYVIWHKSIKKHPLFKEKLKAKIKPDLSDLTLPGSDPEVSQQAYFKTTDGHRVKSSAEAAIDNWLYSASITHAYGAKLPANETVASGFYLPKEKIYIEYFGRQNEQNKQAILNKRRLYKKLALALIEINDSDLTQLDEVLRGKIPGVAVNTGRVK